MNKTVQSIISLISFSIILIIITLFCGGLGFGRLFGIYGIMEYCFLSMLAVIDILVICKVYNIMVGVGMLFYSFVACFYLYRPKFVGVANYKLHIASCRFGGFRRR